MYSLKDTIKEIKYDLPKKEFGFKSILTSYFYNPSFRVLLNYRLGKYFHNSKWFLVRQIGNYYQMKLITKRNCQISYNAQIGRRLRLSHPVGVIIGDNVVIQDNVTIFQQVTLGSHGKEGQDMSYPVIKSNAILYAGAKIIGGITVGENAIVGSNSVVNIDIPDNAIAVGIPCKVIRK